MILLSIESTICHDRTEGWYCASANFPTNHLSTQTDILPRVSEERARMIIIPVMLPSLAVIFSNGS